MTAVSSPGISFTPKEVGEHVVSVRKSGQHVTNSPFKILVGQSEIGDAGRVKVWGQGLLEGHTFEVAEFIVDTRSAGEAMVGDSLGEVVAMAKGRMGPWPCVGCGHPRMRWWPWLLLWCTMATCDGGQGCVWPGRDGGSGCGQGRMGPVAGVGWWLWWVCGHSQDDLRTMAMLQLRPAQGEVVAMASAQVKGG